MMEQDFNQLLNDFEPMMYHLLKKYHVRDGEGEFYQELAIVLWQASLTYQEEKMKFSTYVYSKMQFHLIDLFRKEERARNKIEAYQQHLRSDLNQSSQNDYDPTFVEKIKAILTDNEWLWFEGQILKGQTLVEIGNDHHVTANAIRHYKRKAVSKLRDAIRKER